MTVIYGIPNCDKCRATLKWFAAAGIAHRLHDLRADGLDASLLRGWLDRVPAEQLLNRRSRTWRELSPGQRDLTDNDKVVALVLAHPTLLKRPLVVAGSDLVVGYDEAAWHALRA